MQNQLRPKVLIVDDVPGNIRVLAEILGKNYDIIMSTNGFEVLEISKNLRPDLILLDVYMPNINGFEVCQQLKIDNETAEIPIIFVTSSGESVNETRGLEIGGVDYITKPLNPSVVKARVDTHLRLKMNHMALKSKNLKLIEARQILEEQNQQLREAVKLREEVDRIMRHDLKAPLNSIIGFSEILRRDLQMDSEHIKMCEIVIDSSYKLLDQINMSLNLYKMETGIFEIEPKPVELIKLINKIINADRLIFSIKKLIIQVFIENQIINNNDTFFICGDESLCYSMFNNLIKNAIEASPVEEIVKINLSKNKNAIISITNVGPVPDHIRSRFFEKYISTGKKSGTGLGTYSSKLMAENQKGSINLEPADGKHTTITLTLPLLG